MTVIAGEIFVDGVDVKERVPLGAQLLELFAAALRQNGMAGAAIARGNRSCVTALVISIVAAKTTGPFLVADIVRVSSPISFHFWKKALFKDVLGRSNRAVNPRFVRVF